MGKSSAPQAPDYSAAAKETAAGNLENARFATQANRVDATTPFGSLTYNNDGKAKADNWFNTELATRQAARESDPEYQRMAANPTWKAANMEEFRKVVDAENPYANERDHWTSTVTLSPEQQALLDQQNKTSMNLAGLQDASTSRVAGAMGQPFDMGSVPGRGMMGAPLGGEQNLSGAYDPNRAPKLSGYYDPQQDTNNATQAIMSRVAPQLQRDKAAMDTQLANQGIVQGSEAYKNAQDQFGRQANDAYTQASLQGIDLGMRQQGQNFGQSVQGINTGMGQQGQMFGQTLQNAGFRQGEQAQRFGQENTNYNNSAAARQQAIQEQAYLRSLPLNELNALRTGSQVTSPTFTNAPQQQTTAGPDLLNAETQQYGAAANATNAKNASSASTTSGLMGAATIAAMMF